MNLKALSAGAFLLPLLLLAGCESVPAPVAGTADHPPGPTGHGYALLFDLLGDEKNVAKLLLIKRESAALREVIKEISAQAGRAHQQLEAFAKEDRRLNLKDLGLPAAEVETRKKISSLRGKQLLGSKGGEFELNLLMTQEMALTYGIQLAEVTAAHESDPIRAKFLRQLSHDFGSLEQKVMALMLAHPPLPAGR